MKSREEWIVAALDDLPGEELSARAFQLAACDALKSLGFLVEEEVPVHLDHRNGRIDLVLDGVIALELDRNSPRRGSIAKVRKFGRGLVYCRTTGVVWQR